MSFIDELKRRNVIRVAIAYAIAAWILIEVTATTFPILKLPDWSVTLVTVFVLIGFPLALILAWAYELTPEGVKKTEEVDADASITHSTGRKLDRIIIVALVVALGYFIWERQALIPGTDGQQGAVRMTSIAVLPFANLSGNPEQEYFADGITEDIITDLSQISGLFVIARNSSFQYKGKSLDLREVARDLNVKFVLEGSVRRAGNRVRVVAQLIDSKTDKHLWAERYDRELTDIFEIQSEIAERIADALQATLSPEEKAKLSRKPTANVEAYNLYLQGRFYWNKFTREGVERAIELF